MSIRITIDRREVEVAEGQTLLDAARKLGIDIPTLCHLEKCGPLNTCLVCLVKIVSNGQSRLLPSCGLKAEPGMVIESETEEVHEARRTALELLFSDHVGDCLSPCHRLCPLQLNIPVMLRQVEANQLRDAVKTVRQALPLAGVLGRLCHHPCEQGCRRGHWDDAAAIRDLERYTTDEDAKNAEPHVPAGEAATEHQIVIIGAGPAGLAAAHYLVLRGHGVTIADRNSSAGGSLRRVDEAELPASVLEAEVALLERMGVKFRFGAEVGNHLKLEGVLRGCDAVLLTVGRGGVTRDTPLGVTISAAGIQTDANTCQTNLLRVFAAGAAVKPVKHLVRAMAEGRAAAECIHRFVSGRAPQRPEKEFSSVMGRTDPDELRLFLRQSNPAVRVSPCDRCIGLKPPEAKVEAARCLHCDCRSSGNCVLQHYAQAYNVDANRFRSRRRPFEQHVQPGGVIFEPGKCILCGICVELARQAAEPLGLTFVGRGFDVRVSAPMSREFSEGLRKVAAECAACCPTGAIALAREPGGEIH